MGVDIRVERTLEPFTVIQNRILQDDRLSFKARGVLGYIFSRGKDYQVRVKDIINSGNEGRDAIQSAMKELEACGYAKLHTVKDTRNRVKGKQWTVTDKLETRSSVEPPLNHRQTGFPIIGKPVQLINNYIRENEKEEEFEIDLKKKSDVEYLNCKKLKLLEWFESNPDQFEMLKYCSGWEDLTKEQFTDTLGVYTLADSNFHNIHQPPEKQMKRIISWFTRQKSFARSANERRKKTKEQTGVNSETNLRNCKLEPKMENLYKQYIEKTKTEWKVLRDSKCRLLNAQEFLALLTGIHNPKTFELRGGMRGVWGYAKEVHNFLIEKSYHRNQTKAIYPVIQDYLTKKIELTNAGFSTART